MPRVLDIYTMLSLLYSLTVLLSTEMTLLIKEILIIMT